MKKNLFLCILIGGILGIYIFSRYNSDELELVSATLENEKLVYALQYGVYENLENVKKIQQKNIYKKIDDKYYVYVALTLNEGNIDKLKKYFNSLNINTYVKKIEIDSSFYDVLEQYELLLNEATTNESIKTIEDTMLTKYEELNEN